MTRDQVIDHTKDWMALRSWVEHFANFFNKTDFTQEEIDVITAVASLSFNRAKESLMAYAKEREKQFAEHDRMLDSIEAALQQEFRNGV